MSSLAGMERHGLEDDAMPQIPSPTIEPDHQAILIDVAWEAQTRGRFYLVTKSAPMPPRSSPS